MVTFNSNTFYTAQICRTVTSALSSAITFNDNAQVAFNANTVSCTSSEYEESFAGAICTLQRGNILLVGHSFITTPTIEQIEVGLQHFLRVTSS